MKVEKWRKGEIDWDGNPIQPESPSSDLPDSPGGAAQGRVKRLLVDLRLDSLPSLFTFITLLGPESAAKPNRLEDISEVSEDGSEPATENEPERQKKPLEVLGLRLLELTARTSSVMQVTASRAYSLRDPVVNAFRAFAQLHDVAVSGCVAVVPEDSYAETLMHQAAESSIDFALIPWSEYGNMREDNSVPTNPESGDRFSAYAQLEFIQKMLDQALKACTVGILIDRGFGGISKPTEPPVTSQLTRNQSGMTLLSHREQATVPVANRNHHIFFPFFGSADDRAALRIVSHLARNPHVTASIVQINLAAGDEPESPKPHVSTHEKVGETGLSDLDITTLEMAKSSLPQEALRRVTFSEASIAPGAAVSETVALAQRYVGKTPNNAGDIVVLGHSSSLTNEKGTGGSSNLYSSIELKKVLGGIAEQMITNNVKASLLVIQAGGKSLEM